MLVEHRFVTTLEASEAFDAVQEIADRLGFTIERRTGELLSAGRGRKRAARARTIRDLPQRLRVDYDRGRITLAVSLELFRKPGDIHRDMLLAISNILEATLAHGVAIKDALEAMRDVDDRIDREARRRRTRTVMNLALLFLFLGVLVAIIVALARP